MYLEQGTYRQTRIIRKSENIRLAFDADQKGLRERMRWNRLLAAGKTGGEGQSQGHIVRCSGSG
jgi:hypothetical protein